MLNEINLSRTDLNLLVLFEAVLTERHVGRAAEALRLTPSAVSHGLGRLRRLLNDPLFLKTPKGVVPTARAHELAGPIAEVLARVRGIVSTAAPFDPTNSTRRFTVGAPDGVAAVLLSPLMAELQHRAPGIDIGFRQLLPPPGETAPEYAWSSAFSDLESRSVDIAVVPTDRIPPRFYYRCAYEEEFVIAARAKHPFVTKPTLENYCSMEHLVVSHSGDPHGFVDTSLAKQGRTRRVALTVPNFHFALAVIAETGFIAALPKRLVTMHASRLGLASVEAPFSLPKFKLNAVASKVAMQDAGVAWLFDLLAPEETIKQPRHKPRKKRRL